MICARTPNPKPCRSLALYRKENAPLAVNLNPVKLLLTEFWFSVRVEKDCCRHFLQETMRKRYNINCFVFTLENVFSIRLCSRLSIYPRWKDVEVSKWPNLCFETACSKMAAKRQGFSIVSRIVVIKLYSVVRQRVFMSCSVWCSSEGYSKGTPTKY